MKTKNLLISFFFLVLLSGMLVISGCRKSDHSCVERMFFNHHYDSVAVDSTINIDLIIEPDDAECGDIRVTSGDTDVATVAISGRVVTVKGVKEGECSIVAQMDSFTDSCKIKVLPFAPGSYKVTMNKHIAETSFGSELELFANVEPKDGAEVVWSSQYSSVADVTASGMGTGGYKGVVTAKVKKGITYIYCTVNGKYKDSCLVIVDKGITNLSAKGTSNSYIVSGDGLYMFDAKVKGNSTTSVGTPSYAEVLWESFGNSVKPEEGDLISDAFLKEDGYVLFNASGKKGNAVVAVKDDNDEILWSWHIWCTDKPREQAYRRGAGTLMDRNLGATCAYPLTPDDTIATIGLLYQWGRKDPFLNVGDLDSGVRAASTLTSWEIELTDDHIYPDNTTLSYTISNPTVFLKNKWACDVYDWYCLSRQFQNNYLWNASDGKKTMYDPCPVGWRVPKGDKSGVWATAFGTSDPFEEKGKFDRGFNFGATTKKLVESDYCWYPAAGVQGYSEGELKYATYLSHYWSCSAFQDGSCESAWYMYCDQNAKIEPAHSGAYRGDGKSVRCIKETE